ncbi:hypothetical protein RFN25_05315 [Mesorhizobium abyssinicae]|uniref:hypothetical protein n=1 Tax=Mesorhizobium abyssinicae TaxID=1209958 RepID=UPI002A2432B6|nr:hypothetical protein [Mesorhizobium abyssinicae]MDX8432851.1 hypothetical protein [Mesorhizobium abyssinicae]
MEILLVLIVLGAGVFYFLKGNVRRGAETVRASIFLTGLESGSTVAEANLVASMDAEHMPASMIHNAMDHVRLFYGGKQLPMIAEAYRKGMKPKLAIWNQVLIDMLHSSTPKQKSDNRDTHGHRSGVSQEIEEANKMRNQRMGFDEYLRAVVAEAKRLDGKASTDLHWIELTDDEGTKRAYTDGIEPKWLAAEIVKLGPPPPWRVS